MFEAMLFLPGYTSEIACQSIKRVQYSDVIVPEVFLDVTCFILE